MSAVRDAQSAFATSRSAMADSQPEIDDKTFASRLREAAADKLFTQKDLARASGVSYASIHEYWHGPKQPSANKLFAIAEALGVSAEWLALGKTSALQNRLLAVDQADWIMLDRYDLLAFTIEGKPPPMDTIPLPRPWLKSVTGPSDKLWLTTVTASVGDWLREGEQIVCCDVEGDLVDGRLYILMIDGHAIIRRISIQPDGIQLLSGDAMTAPFLVKGDFADAGIYPVARIAAAFRFAPF